MPHDTATEKIGHLLARANQLMLQCETASSMDKARIMEEWVEVMQQAEALRKTPVDRDEPRSA